MSQFEVIARRDGRWWYIDVPALDGATQARNLGEVELMATEYIAEMTGEPQQTIRLDISIE